MVLAPLTALSGMAGRTEGHLPGEIETQAGGGERDPELDPRSGPAVGGLEGGPSVGGSRGSRLGARPVAGGPEGGGVPLEGTSLDRGGRHREGPARSIDPHHPRKDRVGSIGRTSLLPGERRGDGHAKGSRRGSRPSSPPAGGMGRRAVPAGRKDRKGRDPSGLADLKRGQALPVGPPAGHPSGGPLSRGEARGHPGQREDASLWPDGYSRKLEPPAGRLFQDGGGEPRHDRPLLQRSGGGRIFSFACFKGGG